MKGYSVKLIDDLKSKNSAMTFKGTDAKQSSSRTTRVTKEQIARDFNESIEEQKRLQDRINQRLLRH